MARRHLPFLPANYEPATTAVRTGRNPFPMLRTHVLPERLTLASMYRNLPTGKDIMDTAQWSPEFSVTSFVLNS